MKQAKLLNANERKRLTAIINGKRYPTRNHTIVALSFYAGLRACEIAALKVSDVFDGSGEVRDIIQLASSQTKGNDAATILVSKRLSEQLKKFGKQYKSHVKRTNVPLIFSAKGAGFNAQTIINFFQKLYEEAGISGASSLCGRRQFVTELADKGINARVIQAFKPLNVILTLILGR